MKTEWRTSLTYIGIGAVIGIVVAAWPLLQRHLLDAIVILLFAVVILLWRPHKLLFGLAGKLGFNPARTERINALFKKIEGYPYSNSKLTADERQKIGEELEELTDSEWNQELAKAGQMSLIIGHLQNISALLAAEDKPSATS